MITSVESAITIKRLRTTDLASAWHRRTETLSQTYRKHSLALTVSRHSTDRHVNTHERHGDPDVPHHSTGSKHLHDMHNRHLTLTGTYSVRHEAHYVLHPSRVVIHSTRIGAPFAQQPQGASYCRMEQSVLNNLTGLTNTNWSNLCPTISRGWQMDWSTPCSTPLRQLRRENAQAGQ